MVRTALKLTPVSREWQTAMDRRVIIVFGACLIQFTVIGLLFSYSVFFSVFEEQFGWSRTLLSSCTSLSFFMMGFLAIFGGRLNDRYGPQVVLGISGVVFGTGFALISCSAQLFWSMMKKGNDHE